MENKIEIYNLDSEMDTIDSVENFYDCVRRDFEVDGQAQRKAKVVSLILMNSAGELYIQKREKNKVQSTGIYDKTIGGHVKVGDNFERSLIIECGQNLGISAVVEPEENFAGIAKSLDLRLMAVCKKVDYLSDFMSKKVFENGEVFIQPYMNTMYIGYYDGDLGFINGKKSIMELISLEKLQEMIAVNPYEITPDLKFMLDKYAEFFVPLKR